MKLRVFFFALFLSLAGLSQAQSIKVEESEQAVNGITRRGQQLTVQLDQKFVEKHWKDYLSQRAGKVKHSKGVYTVEGAVLDSIVNKPMRIVSTVSSGGTGSHVWWSLDLGTDYISKSSMPTEYAAAEAFLNAFARKIYREDVLRQINQAEDVLRSTKAEQERVVRQANDIQGGIDKNRKRKQELEAELVRNAEELKQLELSVEHNVKQQEASRAQVQEMEKAVEVVRAKLREI